MSLVKMECGVNYTTEVLKDNVNGLIDLSSVDRAIHPTIYTDKTVKIVQRNDANQLNVYVTKATSGYLRLHMKNNVTTTDESLATTTSDTTCYRVTDVVNCVDVLLGQTTASASTGTWTNVTLISETVAVEEPFDSGGYYNYKQAQGAASYEVTITVPSSGYFNVGFLMSNGSTTALTLYIDDVARETFSIQNPVSQMLIKEYTAQPGVRRIKIEQSTSGKFINFLGVNFSKLKNAKDSVNYDTLGYYRSDTNYDNYVSGNSANDYAIRQVNKWGGSYHGGESNITTQIRVGGKVVSVGVGKILASSSLRVVQEFNIDWTAYAGTVLKGRTEHIFNAGGYSLSTCFSGEIESESYFTTLYGVSQAFSKTVAPKLVDISALADGTRVLLGNNGAVSYANSKGQTISIAHSVRTNESIEDIKGDGGYIYKVDGTYNKYYYGISDRGSKTIDSSYAVGVFRFD